MLLWFLQAAGTAIIFLRTMRMSAMTLVARVHASKTTIHAALTIAGHVAILPPHAKTPPGIFNGRDIVKTILPVKPRDRLTGACRRL